MIRTAFGSNDDVNDNDEREFVDNYMVIRVQQKSKKKIKSSGLGWRKYGIPQNVFPRFYLPPAANVS